MYILVLKILIWLNIFIPAVINGFYVLKLMEIIYPYISKKGFQSFNIELKKVWRKYKFSLLSVLHLYLLYVAFMIMIPFYSTPASKSTLTDNKLLDIYICFFVLYILCVSVKTGLNSIKNISIDFNISMLTIKLDLKKASEKLNKLKKLIPFVGKFKKMNFIEQEIDKRIEKKIIKEITSENSIKTLYDNILKGLLKGYSFLIFSLILHETSFFSIITPFLGVTILTLIIYFVIFQHAPKYGKNVNDELIDSLELIILNKKNISKEDSIKRHLLDLKTNFTDYYTEKKHIIVIFGRINSGKTSMVKSALKKEEYLVEKTDNYIIYKLNTIEIIEICHVGSSNFNIEDVKSYIRDKRIDLTVFIHDSTEVTARINEEILLLNELLNSNSSLICPVISKIDNISPSREPISNVEKWNNIESIGKQFIKILNELSSNEVSEINYLSADPNCDDFNYGEEGLKKIFLNSDDVLLKFRERSLIIDKKRIKKNILYNISEIKKILDKKDCLTDKLKNLFNSVENENFPLE